MCRYAILPIVSIILKLKHLCSRIWKLNHYIKLKCKSRKLMAKVLLIMTENMYIFYIVVHIENDHSPHSPSWSILFPQNKRRSLTSQMQTKWKSTIWKWNHQHNIVNCLEFFTILMILTLSVKVILERGKCMWQLD